MKTLHEYINEETPKYRKKWLGEIISSYRKRIKLYLDGQMDKNLLDELRKKQDTIMNTEDTIERFMMGILKEDMIAQALFEPSTRIVAKEKMFIEYLKEKNINLDIKSSQNIKYKGYSIKVGIWGSATNDATVNNKFMNARRKTYKTPTIFVVDGPKVKQEQIELLKGINNLKVMKGGEFIEWAKVS